MNPQKRNLSKTCLFCFFCMSSVVVKTSTHLIHWIGLESVSTTTSTCKKWKMQGTPKIHTRLTVLMANFFFSFLSECRRCHRHRRWRRRWGWRRRRGQRMEYINIQIRVMKINSTLIYESSKNRNMYLHVRLCHRHRHNIPAYGIRLLICVEAIMDGTRKKQKKKVMCKSTDLHSKIAWLLPMCLCISISIHANDDLLFFFFLSLAFFGTASSSIFVFFFF